MAKYSTLGSNTGWLCIAAYFVSKNKFHSSYVCYKKVTVKSWSKRSGAEDVPNENELTTRTTNSEQPTNRFSIVGRIFDTSVLINR